LPLPLEVDSDRCDFHYTTDGSTPTIQSPLMNQTLAVTDPANLRFKSIATRSPYDADVLLHLKTGTMGKPVRATKPDEKSAYRYRIYAPDQWPHFRGAPIHSGSTANGDIGNMISDDVAGVVDNDYVMAEDGYYIFVLRTSHPARLTLDGKRIIERGETDDRSHRTFVAPLRAGLHKVRCEFVHRKGDDVDFHVFHYRNGTWDNVVK
jgi:hypothetical protein